MNFFEQDQQQEKDYWFNQIPKHGEDVFNYGPNYCINIILNKIMSKFQLPSYGKICMLGTHNCYSFSLLEEFYGKEYQGGYIFELDTLNTMCKVVNKPPSDYGHFQTWADNHIPELIPGLGDDGESNTEILLSYFTVF